MPSARNPATSAAMRSLSLTRSSPAPLHVDLPPWAASAAIAGSSSMSAGYVGGSDRHGAGAVVLDDDRPARLAGVGGRDLHRDARAEAAQHVDERGARRVEADVFDFDPGAGNGGCGDHPERRRREIAGHRQRLSLQALSPGDRYGRAVDRDRTPESCNRSLGVVAGRRRLADAGRALGVQTGQQHRAFHLRARRLGFVCNGVQSRAVDGQRRHAPRWRPGARPSARAER